MRAPAPASIDSITTDLIDRLLKARPKDFDPGEIEQVRRWVHGYQCKRGRDKNPHPPDETILAQLLSLAPATRIIRLIQELEGDRKEPGGQYAWYVTVALQRIHGIQPATLKAKRAELRIAPTRQRVIRGEQQQFPAPDGTADDTKPDPQFARDLIDEIRKRKAL